MDETECNKKNRQTTKKNKIAKKQLLPWAHLQNLIHSCFESVRGQVVAIELLSPFSLHQFYLLGVPRPVVNFASAVISERSRCHTKL